MAFNSKQLNNYCSVEHNNLEHLTIVLKTLAHHQAELILASNAPPATSNTSSHFYINDLPLSSDYLVDIDSKSKQNQIKNLQESFEKLLKSTISIPRVSPHGSNGFLINISEKQCKFVNADSQQNGNVQELILPVYDALYSIFILSNEKFRQHHFDQLIIEYFNNLNSYLDQSNRNITVEIFQKQIRLLLPIIKLKLIGTTKEIDAATLQNLRNFFEFPLLNQEDIYEIIKNKLNSSNYDLISYELIPLSISNGHLGEYYYLKIKLRIDTKTTDEEFHLFAKFVISRMRDLAAAGFSAKEEFFFCKFLPVCSENGLSDLLDFIPKCYLARSNWVLVLDDMNYKGYVSVTPNTTLEYDGLRICCKQLAKLYATTIILEETLSKKAGKKIRLDDIYGENVTTMDYTKKSTLEFQVIMKWITAGIDGTEKAIELYLQNTNSRNDNSHLRSKLNEIYQDTAKLLEKSDTFRNVITHGDTHMGNILLKYDKNNDVSDAILIDFQTTRYNSPGYEFQYFLHMSSTKETKQQYVEQLKNAFYIDFATHLKNYGLNANEIYSKVDFENDLKVTKTAAIFRALLYSNIMAITPKLREGLFRNEEDLTNIVMHNRKQLVENEWKIETYRKFLSDLIEDLIHNGGSDLIV